MKIYNYDRETGFFLSSEYAFESPLEPGVYLIPACATDIEPPIPSEGEVAKFENDNWRIVPIPCPDPGSSLNPEMGPESHEKIEKDQLSLRFAAYITEADPLFFKAQRGEATMDEWKAKVEEIRLRYPNQ